MSLAAHMHEARVLHGRALHEDLLADDELVHDLRVALRRCRSLAQGLAAVDLRNSSSWKQLSAQAKALFDGLGALRDAQVMIEHARRLLPEHAPLHARLAEPLPALKQAAAEAVSFFDVVAWDQRTLLMPPLAEHALKRLPLLLHLGIARYDEARALHVHAMRHRDAESLHQTRIGVKRLRYTLESLLPAQHEKAQKPLKKMQDLLGDIHDLDVLRDVVLTVDAVAVAPVETARAELLAAYKALATGRPSAWSEIRKALPVDKAVVFRCRRAFVVELAASWGVDGKSARRSERAAITLARLDQRIAGVSERFAALLAPSGLGAKKKKKQERALRQLLGFSDDEKTAIRSALGSPLVQAVAVFAT